MAFEIPPRGIFRGSRRGDVQDVTPEGMTLCPYTSAYVDEATGLRVIPIRKTGDSNDDTAAIDRFKGMGYSVQTHDTLGLCAVTHQDEWEDKFRTASRDPRETGEVDTNVSDVPEGRFVQQLKTSRKKIDATSAINLKSAADFLGND